MFLNLFKLYIYDILYKVKYVMGLVKNVQDQKFMNAISVVEVRYYKIQDLEYVEMKALMFRVAQKVTHRINIK